MNYWIKIILDPRGFRKHRERKRLLAAPAGSIHVLTVKAHRATERVQTYQECGWMLVTQTSSQSFFGGTQVTLTLRKGPSEPSHKLDPWWASQN